MNGKIVGSSLVAWSQGGAVFVFLCFLYCVLSCYLASTFFHAFRTLYDVEVPKRKGVTEVDYNSAKEYCKSRSEAAKKPNNDVKQRRYRPCIEMRVG